jgi:hypothetical protein
VKLDGLPAVALLGPLTSKCVAGPTTFSVADAVLPAPVVVDVIWVVLQNTPSAELWTSTFMVHCPDARLEVEKLMAPLPAVAVTEPPQPFTTLGVGATTTFVGRLSVKLALIAPPYGLLMLNVIVLVTPAATFVGLKLSAMLGGSPLLRIGPELDELNAVASGGLFKFWNPVWVGLFAGGEHEKKPKPPGAVSCEMS